MTPRVETTVSDPLGAERPEEPAPHDGAEARRSAQRVGLAHARRVRVRAVAPWAGATMLLVAAVCAGVAGGIGLSADARRAPDRPGAAGRGDFAITRAIPSAEGTQGGSVGIAVSGDRVYVAESRKGFVRVTTREGSAVATIGAGWLRTPVYVAVGPIDGRIYVSDRGRSEVAVFTATGEQLGVVAPQGRADATPEGAWHPLALGFAPDGTLYVADSSGDQSIAVFSPTGSRVATLGAGVPLGRTGTTFGFPNGIAADADCVYVADSNNGRLLLFDRTGAYLRQLAVDGLPRGLALLGDGSIVLTDAASREVSVLDAQASVLGRVEPGETGARFVAPAGVASDGEGTLYVADSVTGQVIVAGTSLGGGRQGTLSATSSVGLLVLSALLAALAVTLGWSATARRRARVRDGDVTL